MATRAPKRPARSREGFDQAALEAMEFDERRSRSTPGTKGAGSGRSGSGRSGSGTARQTSRQPARPSSQKKAPAKKPAAKRSPAKRTPTRGAPAKGTVKGRPAPGKSGSRDPFVILAGWIGRAI